jgi:predicted amidohydrolase
MHHNLRIAAAQLKFANSIADSLEQIRLRIDQAGRRRCDVLLFPECALTGYNIDFRRIQQDELTDALRQVAAAARARHMHVLVGTPTFQRRTVFNSLIVFDRRGRETFRYNKIHLTARDAEVFTPGNALAYFKLDGVPCTAIICHERRYPELVRLPVMMGAQILFHPNAGLDKLAVSKTKRNGRDGIAVRAFENQIFYVFANSVGPQGSGLWSAGDSKIVSPDTRVLALANNSDATLIWADIPIDQAGRKYAQEALQQPAFLRPHWKAMLSACRKRVGKQDGPDF